MAMAVVELLEQQQTVRSIKYDHHSVANYKYSFFVVACERSFGCFSSHSLQVQLHSAIQGSETATNCCCVSLIRFCVRMKRSCALQEISLAKRLNCHLNAGQNCSTNCFEALESDATTATSFTFRMQRHRKLFSFFPPREKMKSSLIPSRNCQHLQNLRFLIIVYLTVALVSRKTLTWSLS